MDLSNNNIRNIRNDAFRNLFVLDYLNLSRNAIGNLNSASFAIADTPVLTKLDLSYNMITEISSEPFSHLPSLRYLHLENNQIKNLADDCFTSLKSLWRLNLRNNKLTALNMTLMSLKSLQTLDVSLNNLHKLLSFEINRCGALLFVNMSYNAIEGVESNCFNQAFSLQKLDLSNNKIVSPIENIMFVNNNQLETLNFYNNSIKIVADDAFKHNSHLKNLNLQRNVLKGVISGKMLIGLQNVTSLDFFNQSITAIRDNAFSTLVNLVYLNLSSNSIEEIGKKAFTNSTSLNVLDISYNKVANLDFLNGSLVNLTELYLNNNRIVKIGTDAFINQPLMKKLDLSNNRIVSIEQFSLPLLNLQYLNITGNQLQGVLKCNVLSPSKYLRFINLSGFNISRLDDRALIDSPLLARVNLSHNAIEYIGPDNFINMDNMYSLDLSFNRLRKLEMNNSNLFNLKALYLNNNRLQNIRNSFLNISHILYLDISNNNITEFSDPIFQTLRDLRVLHASNNRIVNFNNPQTNSLSKLMTLSVSSNMLNNVNLSYYPDLINVDVSNNNISSINNSFFQNLDHLQSIDLSFNRISKLPPGTFQSLKILKVLNVSSNVIQSLRYGSFKGLNRTEVIDLSRNDIHVLDVEVFHECTELKRLIIDYNFITQLDFDRLVVTASKLNALSLGGNPITCKEIVRNYNKVFVRHVEVTSIDKVFEDDNVHGILCGVTSATTLASQTAAPTQTTGGHSTVLIIWCTVLTICIVAVGVGGYFYKRRPLVFSSGSRSMRSTLEFSGSAFNSDLLT